MLRVASVIASLAARTGGPAHNLVASVGHLREAGVDVTIFTTDQGAPASVRSSRASMTDFPSAADTCDIRVFKAQAPHRLAYAPSLWRALKKAAPSFDVIRVHGLYLYPNLAAATTARKVGVPYLVTPHGALNPWIRKHGRVRKQVTQILWQNHMLVNAAGIHTMTGVEAELLRDVVPAAVPRYVVGNGFELADFRGLPPRGSLRDNLGLEPHVPLLLFLGRVSPEKGVDILIRATARLRTRGLVLVVAGPGEKGSIPSLQSLAREMQVEDHVFFVGPQFGSQRLAALADADIFCLPSHAENFGNVVIEAMAAGVPTIVSTEVNLAPEIRVAEAGRVSRRDDEEIAKHCAEIIDASSERDRLVVEGHAFAQRYDWSRIAPQLASMLSEVAK